MQKEILFKCGENTKKINEQKRIFTENGFFLNYTFSISRVEHSTVVHHGFQFLMFQSICHDYLENTVGFMVAVKVLLRWYLCNISH